MGNHSLEKIHPRPVPLVATESQHANTCPEPHVGTAVRGARFGRAVAAMATERRPKRVFVCILAVVVGVKGLVGES